MSKLIFLFAIHNHQPVGNFGWVFERAFRECYNPLIKELEGHPSLKFSLHFSGPLWEYMQERERDCWDRIMKMMERGQVELLGGGFYEPILSIIPGEDRRGQVEMMSRFLAENFGKKPRGLWLTERIWEPNLPRVLAECGIEYTMLDEEHFRYAGVKNIWTSYITEEEGYPLRLFPVDKKLRYLVPFRELDEVRQYFRSIEEKGGVAILGDDGEKFGLWPGTHQWVYEEGWLKRFCEFLEAEDIQTMTCSEFADSCPAAGQVYLPPASYEEMMEWVLEPQDYRALKKLKETAPQEAGRFLRGGFFREYFLKYPESNHLHKRMLLVSREVRRHGQAAARRELYQGQCNDSYWHGVFGGLYLPHLREAAYSHLLEAEKLLPLEFGWERLDYDCDGKEEYLFRGEKFNLLVKPSVGGGLVEIDYKPLSRNISDVLSRREESYHAHPGDEGKEGKSIHELAKEIPPHAEHLLRYDWYPRYSLLDHFLTHDVKKEDFLRMDFRENGDFVNQGYEASLSGDVLTLRRKGEVWVDGERIPLMVQKRIIPGPSGFRVKYRIKNLSDRETALSFSPEWNLLMMPDEVEVEGQEVFLLGRRISLSGLSCQELWNFPLQTLSQSEEGYDIIQQGMCFLPLWKFSLSKSESFSVELALREQNDG